MKYKSLKNLAETSEVLTKQAKKSLHDLINEDSGFECICSHGATEWHLQVIGCLRMFNIKHTAEKLNGVWVIEINDIDYMREHAKINLLPKLYEKANDKYDDIKESGYLTIEIDGMSGLASIDPVSGDIELEFVQFTTPMGETHYL